MLITMPLQPRAARLDRLGIFLVRAGRVLDVVVVDAVDCDQVGRCGEADEAVVHAQFPGQPSRVNFPSSPIFTPSISIYPPLRKSTTMSQCNPLWFLFPVSG